MARAMIFDQHPPGFHSHRILLGYRRYGSIVIEIGISGGDSSRRATPWREGDSLGEDSSWGVVSETNSHWKCLYCRVKLLF